jgi:hypothetical protein
MSYIFFSLAFLNMKIHHRGCPRLVCDTWEPDVLVCIDGSLELDPVHKDGDQEEGTAHALSWPRVLQPCITFTVDYRTASCKRLAICSGQRYTENSQDPLLFSVAQGIFWLSERLSCSTLHLKKGGGREERTLYRTLVQYSLATETSCIDPSVRIVTKSSKVGSLLIFSISLVPVLTKHATNSLQSRMPKIDLKAMFRIRIRRIRMFLGLPDSHPDP